VSVLKVINRINEEIARRVTLVIGTMWCTYAFGLLVLIPIIVPSSEMVIMYVSSSFLQLVFLPLIMVGQGVISRESEKRAIQDHQTIMAELNEIRAIRAMLERKPQDAGNDSVHQSASK